MAVGRGAKRRIRTATVRIAAAAFFAAAATTASAVSVGFVRLGLVTTTRIRMLVQIAVLVVLTEAKRFGDVLRRQGPVQFGVKGRRWVELLLVCLKRVREVLQKTGSGRFGRILLSIRII